MAEIKFTQFLRPNGKPVERWIDMPAEIELLARRFFEAGGSYTSELLPDDNVSLCAEFDVDGERRDIICIIARNGQPAIVDGVEKLVRESFNYVNQIEARDA